MKYKITGLLLGLILTLSSVRAQDSLIRLIVRGDDMGFTHSGNLALVKTFKEGIERSVEVIVPSPWFPEAVALLKQNPGIDIGIHLALSSEWATVKWRPLTYCPSLVDSNGYFFPMIFPNKDYPGNALRENAWKLDEIERELRSQIEMGLRNLPSITHVSTHMGCGDLDPQVNALVKKLAKQYNIDIDPQETGVENIGYEGPSVTFNEKLNSFLKAIESLQKGKTYLFIDHPALDDPEIRAVYHTGYENVADDRQAITDVWTNPLVIDALKKKNVRLINYADLKKKS
ncbi:MAG: polysaccharide deacetylase family protein [Flavitalea sp.]